MGLVIYFLLIQECPLLCAPMPLPFPFSFPFLLSGIFICLFLFLGFGGVKESSAYPSPVLGSRQELRPVLLSQECSMPLLMIPCNAVVQLHKNKGHIWSFKSYKGTLLCTLIMGPCLERVIEKRLRSNIAMQETSLILSHEDQ